ncbi:VOC family protein [Flavobacterium sp. HSC-61S13]|uniref:bleomycin resistance protein n=1 Tax=Flavobacterium sp. HSC-61S13 TaxID=2910963 RepID=UPI00209FC2FB|nr:VOC family protein [Flavobacterium sp. HSC-61S13]MCP1996455.1 catechol 2,3-dioxygenase-like lactoylglutathione lyase family enzyme [Flavobacterium sp. HSC-61S13]
MDNTLDNWAKMVPELIVTDISRSLSFWCDLIGFTVSYDRPEEKFAYLNLQGAQIMLEQFNEHDRDWETAPLEAPFGRGINFQIEVPDIQLIIERLNQVNWPLFIPIEERWYVADEVELGQLQFLVKDPDGYLLRLIEDLGERPKSTM